MSPQSSGILFHLHFLVLGRVPGFVSLLFWHSVPSSFVPGTCLPTLLVFCSVIISSFLLVPGRVPGLVFLLLWVSVSSSFAGFFLFWVGVRGLSPYSFGNLFPHHLLVSSASGYGSGACLPTVPSSFADFFWFRVGFRTDLPILTGFRFIIICWFLLVPGRVPGLVPLLFHHHGHGFGLVSLLFCHSVPLSFAGSFWFLVGFRGLSPYSFGILFHHHLLVSSGSG